MVPQEANHETSPATPDSHADDYLMLSVKYMCLMGKARVSVQECCYISGLLEEGSEV